MAGPFTTADANAMRITHQLVFTCLLFLLCCSCADTAETTGTAGAVAIPVAAATSVKPKNLILMIGDGMGFAQVKAYRYYADNPSTPLIEPLPFDQYLVGAVVTDSIFNDCGADGKSRCVRNPYGITDSASSANTYATGQDTVIGRLGLSEAGEVQASISEIARRQGRSVGMVVTSQITHATPAAFVSHVKDRGQYSDIADQLFDNQWDKTPLASVLLGGGTADLKRKDRDLVAEFTQAGYTHVSNRDELLQADASKLLGLFAPWGLARAWDRNSSVPSLSDMTHAALKALKKNPQGFFLMVEGSQIDWAAHADDVAGVISEMEDFSAAVEVALEFAAQQGDTLVVITADHETGGMSLGRDDIYHWDPRPLRGMKRTPAAMTEEYLAGDKPLSNVVARSVPFTLTAEEKTRLDSYPREAPVHPAYGMDGLAAYMGINEMMSKRTVTGWSTHEHTGVDVPLYAVGPGSERFRAVMQNEEVGRQLQAALLP
jgi:alkaline phosphatase